MINPCEFCQSKLKFIRQVNGNYMYSMVLPEWFVNYFGGKIPRTVKLEAPNGNTYDVRVTENMNRTILKSGWAEFVDANQIKENYSLTFRYLGNVRFEVTIFDSSGREKALCCAAMRTAQTTNYPYVDNSSSSRDGTSQFSSGEGSDSDGCSRESSCNYCKAAKTAALSYTSEEFSEANQSAEEPEELDDLQMISKDYVLSGRFDLTAAQERKIHALVSEIQPKIPVLVVLIKKTNVERHTDLMKAVPRFHPVSFQVVRKDCALVYFPRESQTIRVKVPRKRKDWQCNLRIRPDGRCNLRLGNFIRDNSLREGDLIIFQPITDVKASRFTAMVHLLHKASIGPSPVVRTNIVSTHRRTSTKIALPAHVKEEPDTDDEEISSSGYEDHVPCDNSEGASEPLFILPRRTRLTKAQKKKVLEKVRAIGSEIPIYVAVMNKSCVRQRSNGHCLSISIRYVSRYLKIKHAPGPNGKRSMISLVLQRDGKSRKWDTELGCTSDRARIIKGWPSFSRVNRLRLDDICLFKLMENEEQLKMMVHIIRREKC